MKNATKCRLTLHRGSASILGLILAQGRKLLFYDVKDSFLRKALDDTHQRNPDHPPPEIVIDPVEEIGNRSEDVCHCLFSQVDFI
jgi:hypothetical protein